MGRRVNFRTVSTAPGERSSIGDFYVDEACKRLDLACKVEAAMFVDHYTTQQLIPMLFAPEHVAKLKAAYGIAEDNSQFYTYQLAPYAPGGLALNFKGTGMLTPQQKAYLPNPDLAKQFFDACRTIRDLHHKWGAVKHMLRWFNRNATAGATRAYWPAVMVLCPKAPPIREMADQTPTRYAEPPGIGQLLELVRETAGTVTQLQLLGDRQPRENQGVNLTMPVGDASVAGAVINLNSVTFSL